jgi:hypothetical protein
VRRNTDRLLHRLRWKVRSVIVRETGDGMTPESRDKDSPPCTSPFSSTDRNVRLTGESHRGGTMALFHTSRTDFGERIAQLFRCAESRKNLIHRAVNSARPTQSDEKRQGAGSHRREPCRSPLASASGPWVGASFAESHRQPGERQ